MLTEWNHIFSNKYKYILTVALTLLSLIALEYMFTANSESAGLIMYTHQSPSEAIVKHNNLLIPTNVDVLVDKGDSLATEEFFNPFKITYYITPASESINIRPVDEMVNFKRSIPLQVKFKLKSKENLHSIHIIYYSQITQNEIEAGILAKSSYAVKDNILTFNTNKFGNYQLVHLQPIIKESLIRRSTSPIFKAKDSKYRALPVNSIE